MTIMLVDNIAMYPLCKTPSAWALFFMLVGSLALAGCARPGTVLESPASQTDTLQIDHAYSLAIQTVLDQDSAYGRVRNQATETHPIAEVIRDYITHLDRIDFSSCPEDFTTAFRQHRDAWEATLPFFERFAELRGEMHEVFEAIRERDPETRAALEQAEGPIWSTWAVVDSIAAHYAF